MRRASSARCGGGYTHPAIGTAPNEGPQPDVCEGRRHGPLEGGQRVHGAVALHAGPPGVGAVAGRGPRGGGGQRRPGGHHARAVGREGASGGGRGKGRGSRGDGGRDTERGGGGGGGGGRHGRRGRRAPPPALCPLDCKVVPAGRGEAGGGGKLTKLRPACKHASAAVPCRRGPPAACCPNTRNLGAGSRCGHRSGGLEPDPTDLGPAAPASLPVLMSAGMPTIWDGPLSLPVAAGLQAGHKGEEGGTTGWLEGCGVACKNGPAAAGCARPAALRAWQAALRARVVG